MISIALTFDDGPGPSTLALLDVLAARDVKATFFLIGKNLESRRDVAVRMVREGHVVGNHSYSHARPLAISPAAFRDEIGRTDELLAGVHRDAGVTPRLPFPCRLPYGPAEKDARLDVLSSIGRTHVHWTGEVGDEGLPASELVFRMCNHYIEQNAHGLDAVFCLHDSSEHLDTRWQTVEALRLLLLNPNLRYFTVPGSGA